MGYLPSAVGSDGQRPALASAQFEVSKSGDDRPLLNLKCSSASDVAQPPEFFSAAVLHQLRAAAERQAAKAITRVVITVPAYFDSAHKQATHDAARMAGFSVMRLLPEPVAAAVSHTRTELKSKLPPGKKAVKLLVFDWGGGTLDASVLDVTGPGGERGLDDFSVLGIAGDNMLGGDDLDAVLMKYAFDEFKKATGLDASADKRARSRLKHLAELTKRDLSVKQSSGLSTQCGGRPRELQPCRGPCRGPCRSCVRCRRGVPQLKRARSAHAQSTTPTFTRASR